MIRYTVFLTPKMTRQSHYGIHPLRLNTSDCFFSLFHLFRTIIFVFLAQLRRRFSCEPWNFRKLFRFTLSAQLAGLPNKLHQFPVPLWVCWTLTQWTQAEIEFCTFRKSTDERLNEKCDAEFFSFRLSQGKLRKCLRGMSGLDQKSSHDIPSLLSATVAMREAVEFVRLREAFIIPV